jgi:putative ABC transport system ATP-binding protein
VLELGSSPGSLALLWRAGAPTRALFEVASSLGLLGLLPKESRRAAATGARLFVLSAGARQPLKLTFDELTHRYGPDVRLRAAVSVRRLVVDSGSHLCLVGRSGSGKTTLLNILCGVLVPTSGRVRLDETDLFALGEAARDALRARAIGCVFQTFNLLDGLSAFENLTLAQRFAGISASAARRRASELLERLGLGERAAARPSELSVGEQQRVAIARAVSKRPSLVLADEPTASLDDENAALVIDLLLETCSSSTLVVATHDARLIQRFPAATNMGALEMPSSAHAGAGKVAVAAG